MYCPECKSEYHDTVWLWHAMQIGNSKEWLGYQGRIGDYWTGPCSSPYSPYMPSYNQHWKNFVESTSGFGNTLSFCQDIASDIFWIQDPTAGDDIDPPPGKNGQQ